MYEYFLYWQFASFVCLLIRINRFAVLIDLPAKPTGGQHLKAALRDIMDGVT